VKRKVKFQEGGAVETPSQRRTRLSESFRGRALEFRDAMRREAARRTADQRAIDRLNPGMTSGEAERRAGRGVPERRPDFTTDPRGTTRRGAATGREMVPFEEPGRPARPSASRALAEVGTPRQIPLGSPRPRVGGNIATMGGALALEAIDPLVNYGRRFAERRAEELQNQRLDRMREAMPAGPDAAAELQASLPAGPNVEAERRAAARPRPAAPRPAQAQAPRPREMTADELNEMELRRILAERRREEEAARTSRQEDMGGSGDIGAASARARGEQVGPPGDYNMKKGGIVKKKAGGMVKAKPVAKKAGGMVKPAPKKMMKGGVVAKPKAKAKSMPAFKKGGAVKKGKK